MLPKTRAALSAFYAPFNDALAALLGDERFRWSDGDRGGGAGAAA
jgi:hypothetical protein